MKRPVVIAVTGAVAAIVHATVQTGPIIEAVYQGAPRWLYWILATPLLTFTIGLAFSARSENRAMARRVPTTSEPDYLVVDLPLSALRSATELEMLRRNGDRIDRHFLQIMGALADPRPVGIVPGQRLNGDAS
jgi:hypothetical protein